MQDSLDNIIVRLNSKSSSEQIHAVLQSIAVAAPDPISLEQFLRAIAKSVHTSLKSVKQSYDIILKKLNLKPVDIGLSIAKELLEKIYGDGVFLKLRNDGSLYFYDKTHWKPMSEPKIRAELQEIATNYKGLTDKSLLSMVSDAFGSLKDYLGSNQYTLSQTDEVLPIINCLNGELWIENNGDVELRPHKPESQQLYCLPYNYNPEAKCPKFDSAMLDIFSKAKEPEEMIRHAYELMGYAIQPHRLIPCFWLLIGQGANGKTKFMQTVSRLISVDYVHSTDMASFGKDKFSLSQLQGKLLLIDDDIKMNTVIHDGLLKKLSEMKLITARLPHGKHSFSFLNAAMPIMIGNHYPLCEDLSDGLLRRAMVIPFNRKFLAQEQDNSIFEYIWENEMSGVLNRAIEGYRRIVQRNNKFNPPKECTDACHEFLAHGNPLYCFLSECLEKDSNSRISLPELRIHYGIWAKEQHIPYLSELNKTLKRKLQSLGYEVGMYDGYTSIKGYKIKLGK